MDKLNQEYSVTKEKFIKLVNTIAAKRNINFRLDPKDDDYKLLIKLNKITLKLKLIKTKIGFNILDDEILSIVTLDKLCLTNEEIELLYIYFYFFNQIDELEEVPPQFSDMRIRLQILKQIQKDINLNDTYSYIDSEIYLNKK